MRPGDETVVFAFTGMNPTGSTSNGNGYKSGNYLVALKPSPGKWTFGIYQKAGLYEEYNSNVGPSVRFM